MAIDLHRIVNGKELETRKKNLSLITITSRIDNVCSVQSYVFHSFFKIQ